MDLLPALQVGLGALAGLDRAGLGPAGRVRGDFLLGGLAEAVPQVPAVADLDRAGQRLADGLAVGARAVTAHDLDSRVIPQPFPAKSAVRPGRTSTRRPVSASMSTVA